MVAYEWDIETRTVYEDGAFDVDDHNFSDDLSWYGDMLNEVDGKRFVLVLYRKVYDNYSQGLLDTFYAEVEKVDGVFVLPKQFDSGHNVPQVYHKEIRRVNSMREGKS